MQLKQLARVTISFAPFAGNTRSARELLARCSAAKAVASNPDCKVETQLRIKGDPFVEVEYVNKKVERFETAAMTVQQIIHRITQTSQVMDTAERLQEAGLAGSTLETTWHGTEGRDGKVTSGEATNIPAE